MGETCIGSITEESIIQAMQKTKNVSELKAFEIMGDSLPSVSPKASLNELSSLLSRNPAVLISEKGKMVGIVTKADLLKAISHR